MRVRSVWCVVWIGVALVGPACRPAGADGAVARSRAEVDDMISHAGRTEPEWWATSKLDFPATLRLEWPLPATGEAWQPTVNPGQYLVSVINPNPRQWHNGARLFHHMLTVNRDRPEVLTRVMDRLGHIYTNLLGDYARGAFWYRAAGKRGGATDGQVIALARCYWELGNRVMAADALARVTTPNSSIVQLWAEMGDLPRALQLADSVGGGRSAATVNLAAGNACRAHGDFTRALAYYNKVLEGKGGGNRRQTEVSRDRARSAIESLRIIEMLDPQQLRDGTYRADGLGYRGAVEVTVVIAAHRITSVTVTHHREDWFFTALTDVPRQIVEQQGLKGVDAVTGATATSMAIVNATAKALGQALP